MRGILAVPAAALHLPRLSVLGSRILTTVYNFVVCGTIRLQIQSHLPRFAACNYCPPGLTTPLNSHVTGYAGKPGYPMTHCVRYPYIKPVLNKPVLNDLLFCRRSVSTLVNCGGVSGDRSFMLTRQRMGGAAIGASVILHGVFDRTMRSHLRRILSTLPHDDSPLTLDLRGVTLLSHECLRLLLWAQRDHACMRQIIFHLSATGQPRQIIQQLGLEEKLGLVESLGLKPLEGIATGHPVPRRTHEIRLEVKSRDLSTTKNIPRKD